MSKFLFAVSFLLMITGLAYGQENRTPAFKGLFAAGSVLDNREAAASQRQFSARSQHRCCNRKGALIGAVAGGILGGLLVRYTCDGADCSYMKYIAIAGTLGATIGVFADARQTPAIGTPSRRFRVGGVLTPTTRAGLATFRF